MRVYVSGAGVVSSLGYGREAFFEALVAGKNAISDVERFDTSRLDRHRSCEIKDFDPRVFLSRAEQKRVGRCSAMGLASARMAVIDAGIDAQLLRGSRVSVVMGTTMGEADVLTQLERTWINDGAHQFAPFRVAKYGTSLIAINLARAFSAGGIVQTLPAACAAGNYSIGFASDLIRERRADVVIAGAAEEIAELQYAGFARLGAIAPERCQPFDKNRKGLLLGEGAAVFVLESEAHLVRRGGTPLCEILGYGIQTDGYHITRPHPEGNGNRAAMMMALRSSGIAPADVDYVNAHGTATLANDETESRVMLDVFGDAMPPLSSVKSSIGHCMGASSALEAVACLETLRTGWVPPTLFYETHDPECSVRLVANEAQKLNPKIVLNNALAFGGYNGVLCMARPDARDGVAA